MRYARKTKILELIKEREIYTQGELASILNELGYKVTQATVSRDINELGLVKVAGKNGKGCYSVAPKSTDLGLDKFTNVLAELITGVQAAENLVVIKTLSGCASAAAEVIDRIEDSEIVGSIAGDNTILLVIDKTEHAPRIVNMIKEVIL